MSLINETIAGDTANKLEAVLYDAMTSGNDTIKEFAKKHIYMWYLNECSESYGMHDVNPEIKEEYEKISTIVPHNIYGTMFITRE